MIGAELPPVAECAGEDLSRQDCSAGSADPLQGDQHPPFPLDGGLLRIGCVTFFLDFANLVLDQLEPGIFPLQFAPEAVRQRVTFCSRKSLTQKGRKWLMDC